MRTSQCKLIKKHPPEADVFYYARSTYSPVSVFTMMFSPCLMKSGAFTLIPPSTVTSYVMLPPDTVLPPVASIASVTLKVILRGSSTDSGRPSCVVMFTSMPSRRYLP